MQAGSACSADIRLSCGFEIEGLRFSLRFRVLSAGLVTMSKERTAKPVELEPACAKDSLGSISNFGFL